MHCVQCFVSETFEVLRITEISSAATISSPIVIPRREVALWFFSDTKSDIVVKGEYGKNANAFELHVYALHESS